MASRPLTALLLVGIAAGLAPKAAAQDSELFAAPVRIQAGDSFAGFGRMSPSPAFHDVDGDGLLDLVIGDLPGRVTWARRAPGEGVRFLKEQRLKGADGEQLDFGNW